MPADWRDEKPMPKLPENGKAPPSTGEIHEIERVLAEKTWKTDAVILITRDKMNADAISGQELAERRRDNEMARDQTNAAREQYIPVLRHTVRRYVKNLPSWAIWPASRSTRTGAAGQRRPVPGAGRPGGAFDFDDKGFMGMNDGDASGGQQVMKSLILLVALMMEESRPGGFVFIDEPFAHLDIVNIERVAEFPQGHAARNTC